MTKPRKPPTKMPENAGAYIEASAFAGATDREIAAVLGVSIRNLQRRYGAVIVKKRAERQVALRAAMQKFALKGNATLCIWLGKQPVEKGGLGQIDEYQLARHVNLEQFSDADLEKIAAGKAKLTLVKPDAPAKAESA